MNETEICGTLEMSNFTEHLCSWLTLYVLENAVVNSLVYHLPCCASVLLGLSHLLRNLCQTSEDLMVMLLPNQIWWPAQLTPPVGS